MSFIPQEVINDVREKTDIVEVVGQYATLTKRGNNYSCSCPFHEDRNPSFSIHVEKQIYKCFSCGSSGNVFRFLQEMENLSFPDAVLKAAEFSNVAINQDLYRSSNNTQSLKNQALYDIHEKAAEFYHYYLTQTANGQSGIDYLAQRQLHTETIDRFKIGLAPVHSDVLYQYLKNNDFTDEQLTESGIFYQTDDSTMLDRFRGRLMFPLRDVNGKVVAFSGRVFGDMTSDAKYINSPETKLFQKNKLIFNLDLARLTIRQLKQVIVCEGFMDVIRMDQVGIQHAVATMGTSLTTNHLDQLTKMATEIVFVFDGDDAGQEATNRAFELSTEFKTKSFKAITMPNRLDPDEWLQKHDKESFQSLLNHAKNRFEFQKDYLKRHLDVNDDQAVARYIEQIIALIGQINSPIEQQLRIQDLSKEYQIDEVLIKEQLARLKQSTSEPQYSSNTFSADTYDIPIIPEQKAEDYVIRSKRAFEAEKLILQLLIYHQAAWYYIEKAEITPIFYHDFIQALYFELESCYYDKGQSFPMDNIDYELSDTLRSLYANIVWEKRFAVYNDLILDDCFKVIEKEFIALELSEWKERLKEYQREQRHLDVDDALNHIVILTKKLNK